MSNADPMDRDEDQDGYSRRLAGYVNQRKPGYYRSMHVVTPRQWRRYWHKSMRLAAWVNGSGPYFEPADVDGPEGMRPKGRPTPRRSAARAAMLERRRG